MSDWGMTGIGNYPYLNNLGSFGLGAGGAYGTYADPMMGYAGGYGLGMGYSGSMSSMMPGMMSGYGYGMFNPSFMSQMNQVYHDMENANLRHTSAVNNIKLENQVSNYRAQDSTLFKKAISDNGVQTAILNIAEKIRKGDGDGVLEEYNKLASDLVSRYNVELKEDGGTSDVENVVRRHIEDLYLEIAKKHYEDSSTLRDDIKKYGETAFDRGFNASFFGKPEDHPKRYVDETLSGIYGTSIENHKRKDKQEKLGQFMGNAAECATVAGAGAVVGAPIGLGVAGLKKMANKSAHFGKYGAIGACLGTIAAAAADWYWQNSI